MAAAGQGRSAELAALVGLLPLLLTLAACAPSTASAFAPVARDLEARTGHRLEQRSGPLGGRGAAQVEELLAGELSEAAAVRIALWTRPDLQARLAELGAGRAALVAALADDPELEAELRFPSSGGDPTLELVLFQELRGLLALGGARDAARARLGGARRRALGAAIDRIAATRRAYYEAVAAAELLALQRTLAEAAEGSLDLAERIHAAGNLTDLALAQERARREEARLDLADAALRDELGRAALIEALGVDPERARDLRLPSRLPELPAETLSLTRLEEKAIARSAALAALTLDERVAAGERAAARWWWLPLAIGVSAERQQDGSWLVGPALRLRLPVFGSGRASRIRADADRRRAHFDRAAAELGLRRGARAARARLETARRRASHIRDHLLPVRAQVLEHAQRQFNAMNLSTFELLDARRDKIETAQRYVEARRDYWLARVAVEQLGAGGMPEGDAGAATPPSEE